MQAGSLRSFKVPKKAGCAEEPERRLSSATISTCASTPHESPNGSPEKEVEKDFLRDRPPPPSRSVRERSCARVLQYEEEKLEQQRAADGETIQLLKEELSLANAEAERLKEEHEQSLAEVSEQRSQALQELKAKLESLHQESIAALETRIRDQKAEECRLQEEIARLQSLSDERQMLIHSGERRESYLQQQVKALEESLNAVLAESESRQKALLAAEEQIQTLQRELTSATDAGKQSCDSNTDDIVHFSWRKGQILNGKYAVQSVLGDGAFGRVILAKDWQENRDVAIKMIRDLTGYPAYAENAEKEKAVLEHIRQAEGHPEETSGLVRLHEAFIHEGKFFCLALEPLGASLFELIKMNDYRGFWVTDIQSVAKQSLTALSFLHDKLKLTHTDLKPENILLQSMEPPSHSYYPREEMHQSSSSSSSGYVRPRSCRIKIIDFGTSTYDSEHHVPVITTREYRAPEVFFELGWNKKCDIWSLGCILMELYTGLQLFGTVTRDDLEHFALMEKIVGPIPAKMLEHAGPTMKQDFLVQSTRSGLWRLRWPEGASSKESERYVRGQWPLSDMVLKRHHSLADCVGTMLHYDPSKRWTARDCLKHSFFGERYQD